MDTHPFVRTIRGITASVLCNHYTHVYHTHPCFPLKNFGGKVCIIHSKTRQLPPLPDQSGYATDTRERSLSPLGLRMTSSENPALWGKRQATVTEQLKKITTPPPRTQPFPGTFGHL